LPDFDYAHLRRVTLAAVKDEAFNAPYVCLLCADTVMLEPQLLADLLERATNAEEKFLRKIANERLASKDDGQGAI
jgi:hypothetical protein